jgi:hypothetical protein
MEPVFKKVDVANDTVTTNNEQEKLGEETPLTCLGCEQGVFNQLGHMDKGGCLYDPDY